VTVSASKGLMCKNSDQDDGICEDYKVRFCCPHEWTDFFNRDDPNGNYDYETLEKIREDYSVCENPTGFDARLLHGEHYTTSGDVVVVSSSFGLTCKNSEQKDGKCEDYKIRFCC
ncbi:hypothetical protein LOTGIDRAFT_79274, partial [Lottia gigantea]